MSSSKHDSGRCIGIILDGNRRWAKKHNKPILAGHTEGLKTLVRITRAAQSRAISHVVVYGFSTENWKRSAQEVTDLMQLAEHAARQHFMDLGKDGIRIRFVGDMDTLPNTVKTLCSAVEKHTAEHTGLALWVCLSYGGRAEIVSAAIQPGVVDEATLRERMWSYGMPDPDMIIRTGGEHRLSNFLLFQAAYSELFFTDTLWPDFTEKELDTMLEAYAHRERRLGA